MGKHSDQRDRTLCLARILWEQTDEKHPLTMLQIIALLEQEGLSAERKSIYRDLAAMNKWGFDVAYRQGKDGGWYAVNRQLSLPELQAVIDAVGVYRWMPQTLRETVLEKLTGLCPRCQREQLRRPVALPPPRGRDTESVREILDRIHTAQQSGRAVSIHLLGYDLARGWVAEESPQVITPKGVLWFQEHYYLFGSDSRTGNWVLYRLDQVSQAKVTGLPAQGPTVDPAQLLSVPFGLEPRRRERVRLSCAPALAVEVLDRLGPGAQLSPEEGGFTVTADVIMGPSFWGWLTAHADQATLVAPTWAVVLWNTRYCPRLGQSAGGSRETRQVI